MKKISIILSLLAVLAFSACEDDRYEAPDTLSDVSWYTGIHPGELFALNIGEYLSFMDVSQSALSHEWTIESGNYFLTNDFSPEDSLPLFIDKEKGLSTEDITIHVLFNNPGSNKVRLYNTFADSVTYNGTIPFPAKKEGNMWVIDTLLEIDVYDHIKPSFSIFQDEKVVVSVSATEEPSVDDKATWDTVYVEAGTALKFVDNTTIGRPNNRVWHIDGGRFVNDTKNDSAASVFYYSLGNYTASMSSTRGGDYPRANAFKVIPLIIKVIQSSQPFEFIPNTFVENADQTVSFNVTGELVDFSGEEGNFMAHVENSYNGYSADIPVTKAEVNADDRTQIILTLKDEIYNTDQATIVYNGGNINSVDARTLNSFTAQEVSMVIGANSLDAAWAGFDEFKDNWKMGFAAGYWIGPSNSTDDGATTFFTRVEGNDSPSKNPCMSYSCTGGVTEVKLQGSKFKDMLEDKGTYVYQLAIDIYIEPGSNLSQLTTIVNDPWKVVAWDLSTVEEGKWVTLKQDISFDSVPTKRYDIVIKPGENPTTTDAKFYFDNLSFVLLESRQ